MESLRSPGLGPGVRGSVGGWGLGAGQEDTVTKEEEEDEPLDWDQAQVCVFAFLVIGYRSHDF